jgi:F-box/leucine-rich repeat protein 2/20
MRPFRDDPLGKLEQFLGSRWCSEGRLLDLNFEFVKISDDLLSHVPRSLTSLNLNGCYEVTDVGLKHVASRCPYLQVITLYWNVQITDVGIQKLCKTCKLTDVRLSGCKRLTDKSTEALARRAKCTVLDLTKCVLVSDLGLAMVLETQPLEVLLLHSAVQFTPRGYAGLPKLALKLRQLDVSGHVNLTDACVEAWPLLPRLHYLNCTWCTRLTDRALVHVSQNCPALEWFSLFGNLNITDIGVMALSEAQCKERLTYLDLRGCANVEILQDTGRELRFSSPYEKINFCPPCGKAPRLNRRAMGYSSLMSARSPIRAMFPNVVENHMDRLCC